jgi:amino acid permease
MKVSAEPDAPNTNDLKESPVQETDSIDILASSNFNSDPKATGQWQTFLNLFGATFGISSLGLPIIMMRTGLVLFFLLLAIALFINYVSYRILLIYAEKHKLKTFPEFTEVVGGKVLKYIVDGLFFICNLGTMVGALAWLNFSMCLVCHQIGLNYSFITNSDYLFWIIIAVFGSLPLTLRHKLRHFNWITYMSLVACFYLALLFIAYLIYSIVLHKVAFHKIEYFNGNATQSAYAFIFYCFTCQLNLIGILKETKERTYKAIKPTVNRFAIVFAVLYSVIALTGYLALVSSQNILPLTMDILGAMHSSWRIPRTIAQLMMAFVAFNAYLFTFKPTKEILFGIYELMNSAPQNNQNQVQDQTAPLDEPADAQPVQQPEDVSTTSTLDLSGANLIITFILAIIIAVIASIVVIKQIDFVDVLSLIGDFFIPILFVFIPLGVYLRDFKKPYVVGLLAFAAGVYVWRVVVLCIHFYEWAKSD